MTAYPADVVRVRRGLAPVAARLAHSGASVAYLGASVTVQREGFRPLVHANLAERFGAHLRPINAAVGAVGCISAVFLMDDLVRPGRPALCLLEYTTGDWGGHTRLADVGPAVEGIVRKLRGDGCEPVMLHLYRRDRSTDWDEPFIAEYERVADHYGVPSINAGRALAALMRDGAARIGDWFRDDVHTTPAGAARTADIVSQALDRLFDAPRDAASPVHATEPPPAPARALHPRHLGHTRIVRLSDCLHADARLEGPWGMFRLAYRYLDLGADTELSFTSTGWLKGAFVVVGPDSPRLSVEAAGNARTYDLIDQWTNYERISTVIFDESYPPSTAVTLASEAASPAEPGMTGPRLKIIGLLVHELPDRPAIAPADQARVAWR